MRPIQCYIFLNICFCKACEIWGSKLSINFEGASQYLKIHTCLEWMNEEYAKIQEFKQSRGNKNKINVLSTHQNFRVASVVRSLNRILSGSDASFTDETEDVIQAILLFQNEFKDQDFIYTHLVLPSLGVKEAGMKMFFRVARQTLYINRHNGLKELHSLTKAIFNIKRFIFKVRERNTLLNDEEQVVYMRYVKLVEYMCGSFCFKERGLIKALFELNRVYLEAYEIQEADLARNKMNLLMERSLEILTLLKEKSEKEKKKEEAHQNGSWVYRLMRRLSAFKTAR